MNLQMIVILFRRFYNFENDHISEIILNLKSGAQSTVRNDSNCSHKISFLWVRKKNEKEIAYFKWQKFIHQNWLDLIHWLPAVHKCEPILLPNATMFLLPDMFLLLVLVFYCLPFFTNLYCIFIIEFYEKCNIKIIVWKWL